MTMMTLTQNERPVSSGFRVDVSRGKRVGRVSSEWFSRPDDERYLSLTGLYDAVRRRADRAHARTVESRAVKVEAACDNTERLALLVPGRDEPVAAVIDIAGNGTGDTMWKVPGVLDWATMTHNPFLS